MMTSCALDLSYLLTILSDPVMTSAEMGLFPQHGHTSANLRCSSSEEEEDELVLLLSSVLELLESLLSSLEESPATQQHCISTDISGGHILVEAAIAYLSLTQCRMS